MSPRLTRQRERPPGWARLSRRLVEVAKSRPANTRDAGSTQPNEREPPTARARGRFRPAPEPRGRVADRQTLPPAHPPLRTLLALRRTLSRSSLRARLAVTAPAWERAKGGPRNIQRGSGNVPPALPPIEVGGKEILSRRHKERNRPRCVTVDGSGGPIPIGPLRCGYPRQVSHSTRTSSRSPGQAGAGKAAHAATQAANRFGGQRLDPFTERAERVDSDLGLRCVRMIFRARNPSTLVAVALRACRFSEQGGCRSRGDRQCRLWPPARVVPFEQRITATQQTGGR